METIPDIFNSLIISNSNSSVINNNKVLYNNDEKILNDFDDDMTDDSFDPGEETTIGLTSSHLSGSVGFSLSLAIVDMMETSIGRNHSSVGDDTYIVSSALSNSVGHMSSTG